MGTIVVAVLLGDDSFSVAHLGDTRLYWVREKVIQQLTTDHSVVMEQVRRGLLNQRGSRTFASAEYDYPGARCVGHRRAGAGNSFRTLRRSAAV